MDWLIAPWNRKVRKRSMLLLKEAPPQIRLAHPSLKITDLLFWGSPHAIGSAAKMSAK
jgi:hypothetical protein